MCQRARQFPNVVLSGDGERHDRNSTASLIRNRLACSRLVGGTPTAWISLTAVRTATVQQKLWVGLDVLIPTVAFAPLKVRRWGLSASTIGNLTSAGALLQLHLARRDRPHKA